MSYGLEILRTAQKQLAQISPPDQDRIVSAIQDLADTPRPAGCKKTPRATRLADPYWILPGHL